MSGSKKNLLANWKNDEIICIIFSSDDYQRIYRALKDSSLKVKIVNLSKVSVIYLTPAFSKINSSLFSNFSIKSSIYSFFNFCSSRKIDILVNIYKLENYDYFKYLK
jgi:hypothetical protein